MDSLILTNILLIIIIVFLFAIYKDLNNRVCNLIEQLGRNLNKLNFTANHIKHFILMNDKEKAEAAKIIEKEVMPHRARFENKDYHHCVTDFSDICPLNCTGRKIMVKKYYI